MVQGDVTVVDGEEEPFFGDRGSVLTVQRAGQEVQRELPFYSLLMFFAIIFFLVFVNVAFLGSEFWPLIIISVFCIIISIFIWNREPGTAMVLKIDSDRAVLSYDTKKSEQIAAVEFGSDTVVNVVLNDLVHSKEFGHLFGWSFEDGKAIIKLNCHEGWEVWDIQNLREPIYTLITHHRMDKGPDLRYYQDGLRGVIPVRSRYQPEPAPEPPTI